MPATKERTPADPLVTRMAKMKVALEMLDGEVSEGTAPRDALEDFKTALDHIRISTWALLTSPRTSGHRGVVTHFRLKRASELCDQIVADAHAGQLGEDEVELRRLYAALEEARIQVGRHLGRWSEYQTLGSPSRPRRREPLQRPHSPFSGTCEPPEDGET